MNLLGSITVISKNLCSAFLAFLAAIYEINWNNTLDGSLHVSVSDVPCHSGRPFQSCPSVTTCAAPTQAISHSHDSSFGKASHQNVLGSVQPLYSLSCQLYWRQH